MLRLPEKSERIGKILDRKARLFGEALRREIISVSPRRCATDLDEAFFDTTLEVGVDQTKRDAELRGEQPLGLRAVLLHSVEQAEHYSRTFRIFFAHPAHEKRSPDRNVVQRSLCERQDLAFKW